MEKDVRLSKETLESISHGDSEVLVFDDENIDINDFGDEEDLSSSTLISSSCSIKRSASSADLISLHSIRDKKRPLVDVIDDGKVIGGDFTLIIDKDNGDSSLPFIKKKKKNYTNISLLFNDEPQKLLTEDIQFFEAQINETNDNDSQILLEDSLRKTRKKNIDRLSSLKPKIKNAYNDSSKYDDNASFLATLSNVPLITENSPILSNTKEEIKHQFISKENLTTKKEYNYLVRRGMAETLLYLKKIGCRPILFGEFDEKIKYKPCNNDMMMEDGEAEDDDKEIKHIIDYENIKIEHRDSFGNILTPKEAYKELSYKFHGKGPSAAKLKKIADRRKERSIVNSTKTNTDQSQIFFKKNDVSKTSREIPSLNTFLPKQEKKKSKIFGMQ